MLLQDDDYKQKPSEVAGTHLRGIVAGGYKMKKYIALLLVLCLCIGLCACASSARDLDKELEDSKRKVAASQKAADEAKAQYDRLIELFDQYEKAQEKLNGLKKGTAEYDTAVAENNRIAKQIIKEYPEIVPYVSINN